MIRIISDSSTLYSIEEGKKNNVDISPLSVTISGNNYAENEDIDIDIDDFIKIIKQGHIPIKKSQI